MAGSKTMFNSEWMDITLNSDISSCIKPVPSNRFQAHCSVCHKNFELSNMGRGAVLSHMKSVSHMKKIGGGYSSNTIRSFLNLTDKSQQQAISSRVVAADDTVTLLQPRSDSASNLSHVPSTSCNNAAGLSNVQVEVKGTKMSDADKMDNFIVKTSVTDSDIIWALQFVMNHLSFQKNN